MWNFLVLGFIPGTDFQISFETWLLVAGGLTCSALAYYLVKLESRAVTQLTPTISPEAN